MNQLFCFASVYLYGQFSNDSTTKLWMLVGGLFFLSMFCFGTFLLLIKRVYWCTFFDMRTAKEFVLFIWRNAKDDKGRFAVFNNHKSSYKSVNKELKDWLSENWERWEEEKEDWFTAKMISKIPIELLPEKFSIKIGVDVKGRRKSIDAMVKAEEKEVVVEKARRASANQLVPSG